MGNNDIQMDNYVPIIDHIIDQISLFQSDNFYEKSIF